MTILQGLKERKLVQWALAYLAGAWVVLEVFDLFDGRFGWPSWLFPIVLALLAAGFLITLVLAWYHGEQGRQRVSGAELLIIAGVLAVAGILSSVFIGGSTDDPRSDPDAPATATEPTAAPPRVAVLPLANRGPEEDRPFVDGIHDEIMSQLSKIHSLELTPLTSVRRYRDAPEDARVIGQELGARYIVEGSVQRVDDGVRLRASLIDAAANRVIWNDDYDRDLTVAALLDVQRDIALEVATRLGAEVLPFEAARLRVPGPESLDAYEHYLTGLSHLRAIEQAIGDQAEAYAGVVENLTAAIDAEPDWAPPLAALGTAYHWMASRGVDSDENWPRSRAALERALELDSLYAPAWFSLGYVRYAWEGDVDGAEAAYRRTPHGPPGLVLLSQGRFDEAVAEYERRRSLDPRSRVVTAQLGFARLCVGDYRGAAATVEEFRALGNEESVGGQPGAWLAYAQLKLGRRGEGLRTLQGIEATPQLQGFLALLYALADSTERAERYLASAEADLRSYFGMAEEAATAVALGQRDRALGILERTAESVPGSLVYMRCLEEFQSLDGDPRFERVLETLGNSNR